MEAKVIAVNFANWIKEQPILIAHSRNGTYWASSYVGDQRTFTSEELYELFINGRKI